MLKIFQNSAFQYEIFYFYISQRIFLNKIISSNDTPANQCL
ncbi:hypothetical protein yfred0001_11260 [Yersinia frederiksenii ATCC 33641]|nr:hypothetical protein yfred0001_11260 [Yersinia frederiksenii ATCC 33641]